MIVASLVDLREVDQVEVSVGMLAPGGLWTTPTNGQGWS
jgi:hypothetical protein